MGRSVMERRKRGWTVRRLCGVVALGLALAPAAWAGTTGKLSGTITGRKKEPLVGVNVIVIGQRLGAATDDQGRFVIVNIPVGRITVKASLLGYASVTTENVEIVADNTTRLDLVLDESAVEMKGIVVSANRPVVEVNRTSNIATVTRQQLAELPVQELQDVVNLQAGVVDGHFRGGRDDEVQYQVDGVTVNNLYDNKSSIRLDRSLLEEVQVISGTFDAEYGQAMSGVVNAVLKRGGDKLHWQGEVYSGGPVYGAGSNRVVDSPNQAFTQTNGSVALDQQNYQLSLDGPTHVAGTTFLVSAQRLIDENWVRGTRLYLPSDTSATIQTTTGPQKTNYSIPTGDGQDVLLGYSHEYSGVLKLTNRSLNNFEFSYQALVDIVQARAVDWSYRFDPDGLPTQHTTSVVQGMDVTQTLSPTRFYTLSARQNYKDYRSMVFDDVFDPRYDLDGAPIAYSNTYGVSYIDRGVDLDREVQNSNGIVLKGSFVDQLAADHQFKIGGEFQAPHLRFGSPGYVINSPVTDSLGQVTPGVARQVAYTPNFPGVEEWRPLIGGAFAQEEVEWNDLTLRGGLRLDYFNSRASYPSDLANPANTIAGAPLSHPVRASAKYSVAPRLGVSYPISKNASLFFAYGHFYQYPGLGQIFQYADFNRLADLQAESPGLVTNMGNVDIRPEKTVQYQFGYKQIVTEDVGLDVTAYYKDIRDLLGTRIIETYNGGEYAQLANVDFGSVIGFTVTITQRSHGIWSSKVDYTWQSAQGNSSDPLETAERAEAGEDANPRSIPFNWDQRHTLNVSVSAAKSDLYNASMIMHVASGQPYTPATSTGFNGGLEENSGRKPVVLTVDLRADHRMPFGSDGRQRIFLRVFNLFDTRFDNGFVFTSTGDPYYSRFPGSDLGTLEDPTRFYAPRRIELGLTLEGGGR